VKQDTTPDGKSRYWVRQSWLNDVMICPERARLGIKMPDWRMGSDATHIGTSVHAGIEHILLGYEGDPYLTARNTLEKLIETEPYRINSTSGVEDMRMYTQLLMETFKRDILPSVTPGGMVEKNFGVKMFDLDADTEVWLGGTIDYVDPETASVHSGDRVRVCVCGQRVEHSARQVQLWGDDPHHKKRRSNRSCRSYTTAR
jgi:hypothetical protein